MTKKKPSYESRVFDGQIIQRPRVINVEWNAT